MTVSSPGPEVRERYSWRKVRSLDALSDDPFSWKRRGPAVSGVKDQVGLLTNMEALGGGGLGGRWGWLGSQGRKRKEEGPREPTQSMALSDPKSTIAQQEGQ